MKLGTVVNALPSLRKLASEDMSLKVLYKAHKLLSRLDKEIAFYNQERNRLIESLCDKDSGNQFKIPAENREELERKLTELFDLEIDPPITKLEILLDDALGLKMSHNDLCALDGIVELVEPNDTEK